MLNEVSAKIRFRAPIAPCWCQLTNGHTCDPRLPRLDIIAIHTVVVDERICHNDDLPSVGRIRRDFLVSGHARVEHNLTGTHSVRTEAEPKKRIARFERENCSPLKHAQPTELLPTDQTLAPHPQRYAELRHAWEARPEGCSSRANGTTQGPQ